MGACACVIASTVDFIVHGIMDIIIFPMHPTTLEQLQQDDNDDKLMTKNITLAGVFKILYSVALYIF